MANIDSATCKQKLKIIHNTVLVTYLQNFSEIKMWLEEIHRNATTFSSAESQLDCFGMGKLIVSHKPMLIGSVCLALSIDESMVQQNVTNSAMLSTTQESSGYFRTIRRPGALSPQSDHWCRVSIGFLSQPTWRWLQCSASEKHRGGQFHF